jgi:hypothetical protein
LLKLFEFEKFLTAVAKVKTAQANKQEPTASPEIKDHLFLNVQKKKVKILFLFGYKESQREYIRIVTTKTEYISKMSTLEIESYLPACFVIRNKNRK